MPQVSVNIAVYNGEHYIENAINSVLAQSFQDFEIIVINDGSTDSTYEKLKKYKDSRIVLYNNEGNKGVIYSRNKALELSKGEYIGILDADDTWHARKLDKQLAIFSTRPEIGVCGTQANRIKVDGNSYLWKYPEFNEDMKLRLIWGSTMVHSSCLIKTHLLKELKYKDLSPTEDYFLLTELIKKTEFFNIQEPLVDYYEHSNQFTTKQKDKMNSMSAFVSMEYLKNLEVDYMDDYVPIHKKLLTFEKGINLKEAEEILKFLTLIADKNQTSCFFDQKKLMYQLSFRFFTSLYFSFLRPKSAYEMYFSSIFSKYYRPKLFTLFKFFITDKFNVRK